MLSRRTFFSAVSAVALIAARPLGAADSPATIGLGFSLYGMRTLSTKEALATCKEVGYDCVELPVMKDWPADCAKLPADARRELRRQLADAGLRLTALMENLPALGDDLANLERLKLACQMARDLAPAGQPSRLSPDSDKRDARPTAVPLIETVLGGKAGEWETVKDRLVERLGPWAKVAAEAQVKVAIKAHVGNATQRPEQLAWLLDQVASPWLVGAYDYSHFQLQDLPMTDTLKTLLPRTVFVHVKDTEHALGKRGFLLPGEGTIDYAELFRQLATRKYRGDVVVEVSGQVFSKPGYDPVAACRKCYSHLTEAFVKAGVKRG